MSAEFVDSNVLVYAYDPTTPAKHRAARQLMERLWSDRTGCLSVQVMQEFFWITTRKIPSPLATDTALQILEDLAEWRVFAPSPADVLAAVDLIGSLQVSWWDALILHAAIELDAECLWSEDLSDGQEYRGLRVRNPFAG